MEIDDIIDKICQTEKRGKELLAQAFLIGVGWGRREITDINSLNKAINRLIKDENLVNAAEISCFYKDECYKKYVNGTNYKLFAYPNQSLEQIDEQHNQDQEQYKQENSSAKNKLQSSDQKISKSQELKCQICNNKINKNNYEYAKLGCQHDFHLKCLCQNLQVTEPQCPICKYKITKDDYVQIQEQLPTEYKSTCPQIDCDNSFFYHDQKIFDCKKCCQSWCLECRFPYIENEHQCRIDIDSFKMKIGDKFKYCEQCQKSFLIKHNAKYICNCNKGEQSFRGKIATFILSRFKPFQG